MSNEDLLELNGVNMTGHGGTELMVRGLYNRLPRKLLERFQIIPSRMNVELDQDKVRILWCHDFATDPMYNALRDGGWNNYHKLVFVSNWQMQQFIQIHGIPWSKCIVMYNCIEPNDYELKGIDTINLAYWSTPHRGLNILSPVFNKLCEKYDNIRLHVMSSFDTYGEMWKGRDDQFRDVFNQMKDNDKIINYGSVEHSVLVNALKQMDIMAYPSTYPETFCICLAEAMSAGMLAVHPNLGALYETGASWTNMYQYHEDQNTHAQIFYSALDASIESYKLPAVQNRLKGAKMHADLFYSWDKRIPEWTALLESMKNLSTKVEEPKSQQYFEYRA